MIIIIQAIVILVAVVIVIAILGMRQSYASQAWKKIVLFLLAAAMVVAVLFPDLTNKVANLVGVGRGADLLLYLLVLAFIGYALNDYLHRQRDKDTLYRLARRIALLDATNRYTSKKKK